MPENNKYQRLPSKDKKIKDIGPEDIRVRILGKVIDNDKHLVVDDGSGKVNLIVEREKRKNLKIGDTVRVFVKVDPLESGFDLYGEIVQKLNDLDIETYKKVFYE